MKVGNGVVCPNCGSDAHEVKDSRPGDRAIRRRRHCKVCFARFTTYEVQAAHADALEKAIYFGEVFMQIPVERRRIIEKLIVEFGCDIPPAPPPRQWIASKHGYPRDHNVVLSRLLPPQTIEGTAEFNLVEAATTGLVRE